MGLDLSALDTEFAEKVTSETAPKAPLGNFVEDPNQPRFEFDNKDIEALAADISVRGVLQPVTVIRRPDGLLQIRFGARRLRAARLAGLTELPYLITEDVRQFDDYSQVSENANRKNLTPLEMATFVSNKIQQGEKKKDIAAKLQIDQSAITHLQVLIEPSPFIAELYQSRKCQLPQYLYKLDRLHKDHPTLVEQLCADVDEITNKVIDQLNSKISDQNRSSSGDAANAGAQDHQPMFPSDGNPQQNVSGDESGNSEPGAVASSDTATGAKRGARQADPTVIAKPLLLGTYDGRAVRILLNRKPGAVGLVMLKFEDGSGDAEVDITSVKMTLLTDAKTAD